jgi:3-hydroxybutyryl-CoA dehydrogenase
MKVVVVIGEILKQELLQKPVNADVELIFINDIDEIKTISDADVFIDLEFDATINRISLLKKFLPKPVLINSVAHTLSETNEKFIRVNAWPSFLQRNICEAVAINEEAKINAENFFKTIGWNYKFVPDIKGMISARIVASIINEAYFTLHENVSTKEEIDIAMKLGTNYPYGPFEWSKKIGLKNIYELLSELSKTDNKYNVSEALENEINKMKS